MVSERFDLWKGIGNDDILLKEAYSDNNYRVVRTDSKYNRCLICFSGNGLYYPNTREEFLLFVKHNRYEWENIVMNERIRSFYRVIILVRDIYKQWYVTGINNIYDNQDKVAELLMKICIEENVNKYIVTVGNSAGGYAAVLFGLLLKAEKIFCYSGQFDLNEEIYDQKGNVIAPFLEKTPQDLKDKYFNLPPHINQSGIKIYYFYPAKCSWDIRESSKVANSNLVYRFPFDKKGHGMTMWGGLIPVVLTCSDSLLCSIAENRKTIFTSFDFSLELLPLYSALFIAFNHYFKKARAMLKSIFC